MRVLIAEDEVEIAKALKVILEKNNYTADVVHDGKAALDYAGQIDYDILILDIMMPEKDGMEALCEIRKKGIFTPVLLLTAKGDISDRVAGLNAGADDYLPKPFDVSELVARVRALTRRSDSYAPEILTFQNLSLDCNRYEAFVSERTVRLNKKEFQMMEMFIKHPHHVFSSEHLMDKIWGLDSEAGIDVVWTYIGFLRKKLKALHADAAIKTIRGAGYALEESKC